MIADEAALLEEALRAADAVCDQLELMAVEGGALAVLLALAEDHREAVVRLCDLAGLPPDEAPRRIALVEAVLSELRDIAVAAAAQYRELARHPCARRSHDCRQRRTRSRRPS